jgi:hypothetical protein
VGLDGTSCRGPLQERWLTVGGAHDDGPRAIPNGREAQAAESVGDELETLEADGFIEGKKLCMVSACHR